jgi:hypothetical protein
MRGLDLWVQVLNGYMQGGDIYEPHATSLQNFSEAKGLKIKASVLAIKLFHANRQATEKQLANIVKSRTQGAAESINQN